MSGEILVFLTFILMLSIFVGFEIISKVPSILHTPLMSGANAISGITLLGAVVLAGSDVNMSIPVGLGVAAVAFAMTNVVGGYLVTDRMLEMFKKKESDPS
ncbi:MAG: NAD(P) transhydrogenase subunit alpha [Candidatus Marinamargulisbacteria bacterium]|jgi:NAD(P) transhydrogenase subunit alpha